uniref:Uncharacterized protein n=1 Tax=Rhizophora mucronata TaxID=61149 RepID=A0A2P2QMH0_RHIMU
MQGRMALPKIGGASVYYGHSPQTQTMTMPCGMPTVPSSGHAGGYYQTRY